MNAGAAQVGIHEEDANPFLREHDGGVDAGGRLAFLRTGAGHHDDFGGAPRLESRSEVRRAR